MKNLEGKIALPPVKNKSGEIVEDVKFTEFAILDAEGNRKVITYEDIRKNEKEAFKTLNNLLKQIFPDDGVKFYILKAYTRLG